MDVVVLSLNQYMEQKRKVIDRYVEGEHKWFGDLSTSLPPLSMYESPLPWYIKNDTHPNHKGTNWGRIPLIVEYM
jgi:hypothetical protein